MKKFTSLFCLATFKQKQILKPFGKYMTYKIDRAFCQQHQLDHKKSQILDKISALKFDDGSSLNAQNYILNVNVTVQGDVQIQVKLDNNFRKVKELIQKSLKEIQWVTNVDIKIAPKDKEAKFEKKLGLRNTKKIIAVSSCKGGVGKSTVAVNIAFALQKLNKNVGIFDADIFGPSLPTLLNREDAVLVAPEDNPKEIIPIEYEGIKSMSFGYAKKNRAIMRGPMVSSIVTQLVYQTNWGDLDYLVVDMPPGTGDIQITLCQELKFDAAVIVTTPQRLSFIDVVKGIQMFDDLKIPTVSVIENMAYFLCGKCDEKHMIFGPGYLQMLQKQFGILNSFQIPLLEKIASYSDKGSPAVLTFPESHAINQTYDQIAKSLDKEIERLSQFEPPHVRYETGQQVVVVRQQNGEEKKISSFELRAQCRCAACVDEFTGKQILKRDSLNVEVYPHKIEPKGNYAVYIAWSDGHQSSIYPYSLLLSDQIPVYEKK